MKHRDLKRPILIVKKGQLNPSGAADVAPKSPKVSRDVPEAWVASLKATKRNPIAEFNALFVQEVQ